MRFGGLVAVDDLSFAAARGEITAIIGPNGAGKTTVFNCVTGFYRPRQGTIRLVHDDGRAFELQRMPDFRIARYSRVARTFQNIRLFAGMTALENLLVAQHNRLMRASGMTLLGIVGWPAYHRRNATPSTRRAPGSRSSALRTAPTIRPVRCPTAPSGASKSRGPCAPIRRCSASTSRPPA